MRALKPMLLLCNILDMLVTTQDHEGIETPRKGTRIDRDFW